MYTVRENQSLRATDANARFSPRGVFESVKGSHCHQCDEIFQYSHGGERFLYRKFREQEAVDSHVKVDRPRFRWTMRTSHEPQQKNG